MAEHVSCPRCRHGNPPESRFCGMCGALLTSDEHLAPRREGGLPIMAHAGLPTRLKPVGKALAIGAVALAAEAGLTWLRRRSGQVDRPLPAIRSAANEVPERLVIQSFEELFLWRRGDDLPDKRIFVRRVVRSLDTTRSANRSINACFRVALTPGAREGLWALQLFLPIRG